MIWQDPKFAVGVGARATRKHGTEDAAKKSEILRGGEEEIVDEGSLQERITHSTSSSPYTRTAPSSCLIGL
jgi:hypothetical protein